MSTFTPRPIRFRCHYDGKVYYVSCVRWEGKGEWSAELPGLPYPRRVHSAGSPAPQLPQSTGLHDADGREVFEGDIVEVDAGAYTMSDEETRLTVEFREGGWQWDPWFLARVLQLGKGRVVGNVFEAPAP